MLVQVLLKKGGKRWHMLQQPVSHPSCELGKLLTAAAKFLHGLSAPLPAGQRAQQLAGEKAQMLHRSGSSKDKEELCPYPKGPDLTPEEMCSAHLSLGYSAHPYQSQTARPAWGVPSG